MKSVAATVGLALVFFAVANVDRSVAATIQVDVTVVDAEASPVEGAEVAIEFMQSRGADSVTAMTDANGKVSEKGTGDYGTRVTVNKKGYYQSRIKNGYGDQSLTMVLREKRAPIDMSVMKFSGPVPAGVDRAGFDFSAGDWVSPHGRGATPHIYFEVTGGAEDTFNYLAEVKVSFPGKYDGIYSVVDDSAPESSFRLPYEAAGHDFQSSVEGENMSTGDPSTGVSEWSNTFKDPTTHAYVMRLNTVLDDAGEIESANYGKVRGDFVVWPYWPQGARRDTPTDRVALYFTYYYNEVPNDHNLEFDPRPERLRKLPAKQRVRQP